MSQRQPQLHLLVSEATHFVRWEMDQWSRRFDLVPEPSPDAVLLAFGPDVLFEGARMPAAARYANLFPGFGANPVHDRELRVAQRAVLSERYTGVFINPGPLEIAYSGLPHVHQYPFSVDVGAVPHRTRTGLGSLLHASADYPQKDVERNRAVLRATELPFEIYPARRRSVWRTDSIAWRVEGVALRKAATVLPRKRPGLNTHGYRPHSELHDRYLRHDGFVHVAADIKSRRYLDGKYTATLMEAGVSGAIIFWHDTFDLGNGLETVIEVPADPARAAEMILDARAGLDVRRHSAATREEFMDTFQITRSVAVRAEVILETTA